MNAQCAMPPAIEVVGRGPPLVMLHGWGMHSGIFGEVLDDLGAAHTLHLVDLPGHGRAREVTWPDDLGVWVEALSENLPPGADWLGWSLGGLPALLAAGRPRAKVRRLVLAACNPCYVARPDWPGGMDPDVFKAFAHELSAEPVAALARFLALEVQGGAEARGTLRRLRESALRYGPPAKAALERALALLGDGDFRSELAKVAVPTLVIGGSRDRLTAPRALHDTANRIAPGELVLIEGAAHAPFLSHRREFVAAVQAFLR